MESTNLSHHILVVNAVVPVNRNKHFLSAELQTLYLLKRHSITLVSPARLMTKESIQMITKMESNIYEDVLLEAEMSYQTLLIFWRKFTKIFKCVLLLQKQFLFYFLLSKKKCVCKKGFLCEVLYVNYVKIQQVAAEELQFDQGRMSF